MPAAMPAAGPRRMGGAAKLLGGLGLVMMLQRLRRALAGLAREEAFRLTGVFERAVWLIRRLALLEGERAV
ncbi:MAG: hypothetical protein ACK44F_15910 [Roseococcus sp.]